MQLPAAQARQVLRDEVVQVRIPVSHAQPSRGRRVAVKGDTGGPAVCYAYVRSTRPQLLSEASYADVRAEGYPTMGKWVDGWLRWRDFDWWWDWEHADHDRLYWVRTEFENRFPDLHPQKIARFRTRWANRLSVVLVIARDRVEAPRLLAERSEELYVSSTARALRGEPQAVSEDEQKRITEDAGKSAQQRVLHEQQRRNLDLGLLSIEERLVRAQKAAERNRVSIRRELHLVRHRLASGSGQGSVARMLERAEIKAYKEAA